ncbi:MAG TPA: hypothetical protein VFB12_21740 [Ktedonobacteraceae bacterium]|nr:hypothetical protein [Ktedonobacteraceae bacterium]
MRLIFSALFLILGAVALGGGLFLGFTSHQVTYKTVERGIIAHYLSGQSTGYMQMSNNSTLYIVHENDFAPKIDGTNTLLNGDMISFVYDSSSTTYIDQQSVLKTHLVGNAYKIVQITLLNNNNQTAYTTAEYVQYPEGHYQNNWLPFGATLVAIGLLMMGGSFLLPKKVSRAETVPTMGEHIGVASLPYSDAQPFEGVGSFESGEDVRITSTIPYISLPLSVPHLPSQSTGASRLFPSATLGQSWSYEQSPQEAGGFEQDVQITSTIPYLRLPSSTTHAPESSMPKDANSAKKDMQNSNVIPRFTLPLSVPQTPGTSMTKDANGAKKNIHITGAIPRFTLPLSVPQTHNSNTTKGANGAGEDVQITSTIPYLKLPTTRHPADQETNH